MELNSRGYRCALLARDEVALGGVADEIAATGVERPHVEEVDVTDSAALGVALERSLEKLGGRLDLLVNNAGSALKRARLTEMTDDDWRASLDLNLMAAVRASRVCFDALSEAGGCIVNVSSVVSDRATPTGGPYVAAKAALDGLTRVTALEWARHGIRCFAVAPGYVDTDFNASMVEAGLTEGFLKKVPTRTAIAAEDVARLIVDLASPAHGSLTGAVIPFDGGLHVTL